MVTGSQLAKWKQHQDNPSIQYCPFCGQIDTIQHRFQSCSATEHLRKEYPDVTSISTAKLTTGLLHYGYDWETLKIFQMIRPLQTLEQFPVECENNDPVWVWTDGTA